MRIAIVTDSTSDIPPDLAKKYSIHIVPAVIVIDGQDYQDGKGISREMFYQQLPEMETLPTTAAPAIGAFEVLYEKLSQDGYDQIVSIHVTSKLSGMHNAAYAASLAFEGRVHVVDSRQLTMGLGYQVIAAAEAVMQGEQVQGVINKLHDFRLQIRTMAMLDTLEYLRRSGRVSWVQANLGSLLRLKLFVEVRDGEIAVLGQTRTRRRGVQELLTMCQELGPLERLAVLHTDAEKEAHKFFEMLNPELHDSPLIINVTTVIGTHVGPNGLGFAAVLRKD
jgi:DegV family protein with EDD domain